MYANTNLKCLQGNHYFAGIFLGNCKLPRDIIFGLFLVGQTIAAQKIVKKTLVNPEILQINIDVGQCYDLKIQTIDTNEMAVEAIMDGEYKQDLVLQVFENGGTMHVATGFQPNFMAPNDKLGAHKVVSIALAINVPRSKNIHIFGTSCNVLAQGDFQHLKVALSDGRCELDHVSRSAEVTTLSGAIYAGITEGEVVAESKYGKVTRGAMAKGSNSYILRSVTGNIVINRVE